jgi:hypothetical protein
MADKDLGIFGYRVGDAGTAIREPLAFIGDGVATDF